MRESRKLAAILAADVVGYSRLVGADEDSTLARLRELRSALIDPTIADHNGRVVKRTGDGALVEYRSAVDAVRCAIAVQRGMIERNEDMPEESRIVFRIGVHVGDVVEEGDGDLMGDGVNIAARLEGVCEPGGLCLSAAAYEQVRDRLKESFVDLGEKSLKNIARPVRVYALDLAAQSHAPAPPRRSPGDADAAAPLDHRSALHQFWRRSGTGIFRRRRHGEPNHRPIPDPRRVRDRPEHCVYLQRQAV